MTDDTNDTTCAGPCRKKKPELGAITTGAAILGLTVALAGCPPMLAQPEYGVAADDDDSAEVGDDDDSTEDVNQPLYGAAADGD